MTYQTCLWPARSNATHNRFGGRRLACSCSRCRFGSSRSWLVNVSEDRAIVVVVLRQQGSDFAQFSWSPLEPWVPKTDIRAGANLLNFARSFAERLEGLS